MSGVARISPHLRGHLFLFEARPAPEYDSAAGWRLLLVFLLLEGVIGPRAWLLSLLRLPSPPPWLRVLVLLALSLVLIRSFARVPLRQIGLYPWREWSRIEKSYFLQVFPLVAIVFSMIFAEPLRRAFAERSWGTVALVFATNFVWGFYQEVSYRGILQTELTRRWGALPGILVSNTLFTFGPLHFYHLSSASPWPMFAAIFGIGLFFGVLRWRSGNLCMVGLFHGLGDCFMTGLVMLVG